MGVEVKKKRREHDLLNKGKMEREIEIKMAFSGYVWSEPPSMTVMKYCRQGFVEKKPFLPGERYSVAREMESNVKGFREVSRNLSISRREAEPRESAPILL